MDSYKSIKRELDQSPHGWSVREQSWKSENDSVTTDLVSEVKSWTMTSTLSGTFVPTSCRAALYLRCIYAVAAQPVPGRRQAQDWNEQAIAPCAQIQVVACCCVLDHLQSHSIQWSAGRCMCTCPRSDSEIHEQKPACKLKLRQVMSQLHLMLCSI